MTGTLWYFINDSLHEDLRLPTVTELTKIYYNAELFNNPNPLTKIMFLLFSF